MNNKMKLVMFAMMLGSSQIAFAGENHTLFNPTPDSELRPMATERSSRTDSTTSIDAGRFQIETSLFAMNYNDDCVGGSCTTTRQNFFGGSTNLRIGLTNHVDFQIITDLYRELTIKDKTAGTKTTHQGFGDTILRLKVNLMGNDPSEKFSIAMLPYVKLPTNQDDLGNDDYEGGFGIPVNYNFDGGWSVGGMTQVNAIRQLDDSGYDQSYANSVFVAKSFTDVLSGYAEFYTYKADQSGARWANTADFGTMYSVTDNFKIDANVIVGVTDAADDFNFSLGTNYRF